MDAKCCKLGTAVEGTDPAADATAQSSSIGRRRGASPSARAMHSMSDDDGETALKMAFEEIDKAELFPHAEAPE